MIRLEDWHRIDYRTAWERQTALFNEAIRLKQNGAAHDDIVVMCEHEPVITLGRNGNIKNLLLDTASLAMKGVEYFHTDRGGDITFHGPGQLVVYPIIDLQHYGIGLKEYVSRLEQSVITLLSEYAIAGSHVDGASGVWLDAGGQRERKICAVGIRASHHVTMHGIGLNVNTDLNYFKLINPCGFVSKGVTSMQAELGEYVDLEKVKARYYEIIVDFLEDGKQRTKDWHD